MDPLTTLTFARFVKLCPLGVLLEPFSLGLPSLQICLETNDQRCTITNSVQRSVILLLATLAIWVYTLQLQLHSTPRTAGTPVVLSPSFILPLLLRSKLRTLLFDEAIARRSFTSVIPTQNWHAGSED